MKIDELDYELPESYIAQHPSDRRETSKLLIYFREDERIIHTDFKDISKYIKEDDILVLNDTRVLKARLLTTDLDKAKPFEILLLRQIDKKYWKALINPYKKVEVGLKLKLNGGEERIEVSAILPEGKCIVKFDAETNALDIIDRCGQTPLPPYIKRPDGPTETDEERYQTIYGTRSGSVAAPTAGLHFSDEILTALREKGVDIYSLTLHIGYGTFKPIRTDKIEEHDMEEEYYSISQGTARAINNAILKDKKVIACGTSTVRALESSANEADLVIPQTKLTDLFIYPGYEFSIVEGMITNFHLPKSTLIALVSAFVGREKLMELYELAIEEDYRFYSYGDAMLIL